MEPVAIAGYTMPLGKYRGITLAEIAVADRSYLEWAAVNLGKPRMRKVIQFFLDQQLREVTR